MEAVRFVLDSYALLAFLEGGKGHKQVGKLLEKALDGRCTLFLSIVNLGEVLYITERERGLPKAQAALARIDELPIKIVEANRNQTLTAAHIKAKWPIAYADAFAAALAKLEGAPIVTGDPEFEKLEAASLVTIVWLESSR